MRKTEMLKRGRRIAFISALVNLFLALMKGAVGYLGGSPILLADAFHSSADLMTHAASGFGLWFASRAKTAKFPYGLYRTETLACLIVGGFISVAGIELFKEGYHKLFYLIPEMPFPILPVAACIVSAVCAYVVAGLEADVGKSIGSRSLIANSKEAFLDIFTSLIVLIGILMAHFRVPYVEGGIIVLISLLLLKLGLENVWTSLLILLDANLDPILRSELQEKINELYGVKGISEVRIRQSGPFYMVECIIATRSSLTLYKAHELADKVETLITKNYERIESVFVHVEPIKDAVRYAMIPVRSVDGVESLVHNHLARAPYFMILKLEKGQAEIEDFYYNEFLGNEKHVGVKIARVIINYKVDVVFAANVGEIAFHMMKDNLVDIYHVEEEISVKRIIEQYRSQCLQPLPGPTHSIETSQAAN